MLISSPTHDAPRGESLFREWKPRSGDSIAYDASGGSEPQIDLESFATRVGAADLVSELLWDRGLRCPVVAERFLNPKLAHLSPPFELPGMDAAADRLGKAIADGERIAICGDYDVDGMTATALLVRFFRLVDANITWSIPRRNKDGYGLSADTIANLADDGVTVAVTVDNGITAFEAIDAAAAKGIDVVVTDHHPPADRLPAACAIVNPHLETDGSIRARGIESTNTPLCGCGVAFKLAWGIADRLRHGVLRSRADQFKRFMKDAVGLVAIATVADVVPLCDENRVLVASGLKSLRASPHPGIRALLDVSEVGELPLTTEDIGFRLGPRLNAAGRLSQPELVIQLLTSEDAEECAELAKALNEANFERRRIEQGVLKLALAQTEAWIEEGLHAGTPRKSIAVWGEGWHVGVIGIVAARLVDRFHLPTTVIGMQGESGRGSCRTPSGFDLHQALQDCDATLTRHGGHAMAAGLEVDLDQLDAFRSAFERAITDQARSGTGGRTLDFDAESELDAWDVHLVESVGQLAPFGNGNPEPVFVIRGAKLAGKARLMGKESAHLSFALKQTGGAIRVVAWRKANLFDMANAGEPLDLAVVPSLNHWRGKTTAEFRLIDMRRSS